jgi:small subunit ribosomal protein S18
MEKNNIKNINLLIGEKIINYKEPTLSKFLSETINKIIPRRITDTKTLLQRQVAKAIKKARYLALLPYCNHRIKKLFKKEDNI